MKRNFGGESLSFMIILFLVFFNSELDKNKNILKYIIDYDGDHASDISVYSFKYHTLFVRNGTCLKWAPGFEISLPILGDYNGDGKTDMAFYDKGFWHIKGLLLTNLGQKGDIPVPGDYDGDGKIDLAIWTQSRGCWQISKKAMIMWGEMQDIPLPMDYDGDSKADIAVWRPSDGKWYIKSVAEDPIIVQWGIAGDIPVPGDYDGDGKADIAVWRPSDGKWYIIDQGEVKYGTPQDIPMTWNIWILWAKKLFSLNGFS